MDKLNLEIELERKSKQKEYKQKHKEKQMKMAGNEPSLKEKESCERQQSTKYKLVRLGPCQKLRQQAFTIGKNFKGRESV